MLDQVAQAVRQALESDSIQQRFAAIGAAIDGEAGLQKAVALINSLT